MAVLFNPVAQAKFVHTVSAGYVTGAVFVLAISAFYLLRGRHIEFAKRSMTVAASFGLAAALSVVVLGDESGYTAGENQKMKIAAIEAMWETEPAPASFTIFGLPDQEARTTHYEDQGALDARPDRHALHRHGGSRHQRPGRTLREAHRRRPDRLSRARSCRAEPQRHAARARRWTSMRRSRLRTAAEALSAPISATRRRRKSTRRPGAPCRMCRSLFWASASWSGWVSLHRAVSPSLLSRARSGSSSRWRLYLWRLAAACRCPGSRPSSAGSSPSMAASPG